MIRKGRIFLALSLALLVSDLLFVTINYQADRAALQQSLTERGKQHRSDYRLTLQATLSSMQQMATLISHDQRVQQLFLAGKKAVEAEGGGPGGEQAARLRTKLLEEVGPSWARMTEEFDARQLHFHLGPGSLSYLRVHRPEKYGDRMDDLRHIIVDSYEKQAHLSGFETGRVYSGLRGVVPVHALDPQNGQRVHVGTLEVGTSFNEMFATLDQQLDVGVAALLRTRHVEESMWDQYISRQFEFTHRECDCKVEASSRPVEAIITATIKLGPILSDFHTHLVSVANHHYAVTHFPLFDYLAERDHSSEHVGAILMWSNADAEVAGYQTNLRRNLTYAVFGFILLEILLWYTIRLVTGRLESVILERTREVSTLNRRLGYLADTDELTGLSNRRHLLQELEHEVERSRRHRLSTTLLMFDLDQFKRINDSHGHQWGDEVLRQVAAIVQNLKRSSDIAGRYGGEEFCLLLPHTDMAGGTAIAERLRAEVAGLSFVTAENVAFSVTVSIGVAELLPNMGVDELISAADKALYLAKHRGRNCVVIKEPSPPSIQSAG